MSHNGERRIDANELVQLARLALNGKSKDVTLFVRRLVNRYRIDIPELSGELGELLRNQPSGGSSNPLRGGVVDDIPVDLDSRLQLARPEYPVRIDRQPIWPCEVQQKLREIVSERERERELAAVGLAPTRSALFTGAPGVGKTLAARWIAEQLELPLITLDLAAVMSSFLGRTGNNMRNVMDYARGVDCVLLLDEFDAVAKRRDDAVEVGELKRLVTVLLQEIDTWPPSGLLIAATNHPELLDPAVWRRFDSIIEFPMPSESQIAELVRQHLQVDEDLAQWVDVVALALVGLSYSDVDREIARVKRSAVLNGVSMLSLLQETVRDRAKLLKRDQRNRLASDLFSIGITQRDASAWTGVSRDTIRKNNGQQELPARVRRAVKRATRSTQT